MRRIALRAGRFLLEPITQLAILAADLAAIACILMSR